MKWAGQDNKDRENSKDFFSLQNCVECVHEICLNEELEIESNKLYLMILQYYIDLMSRTYQFTLADLHNIDQALVWRIYESVSMQAVNIQISINDLSIFFLTGKESD